MARSILLRIGDCIFVLRPLLLVPAWSLFLLGAGAAANDPSSVVPRGVLPDGIACLSAILISAYLLNQVFDQESDRRNDKCHYLPRGIFRARTVVLLAIVFFLVATYLFRSVKPPQKLPLILALVLSLVYSLPPLRLVAKPFLDMLANAVGYGGIAFVTGFAAFDPGTAGAVTRAVPYVFLVGATFLYTTILDEEGDRASGKISTTVLIGARRSADLAVALVGAGVVWAWVVYITERGDWLAPVLMSVAQVVFTAAAVKLRRRDPRAKKRLSSNVVQWVTLLVTFPAAFLWPMYLILLVPLVVLSRFYYRARFGLDYPGPAKDV